MRRFMLMAVTCVLPAFAQADEVALYRFANGFDHYYTSSCDDPPNANYCYVGIEAYLQSEPGPGLKALHLLHLGGRYLFTWNEEERKDALANGYQDKGVLGYVSTNAGKGASQLYRSSHPQVGDQYLTIDEKEAKTGEARDALADIGMMGAYVLEPIEPPVYARTSGKNQCPWRPARVKDLTKCEVFRKR